MKMVKRWLSEIWKPEQLQDLDIALIAESLNDMAVRTKWLENVIDSLAALNLEIDRRVLTSRTEQLTDLCARRKAFQDILESVVSARRSITQQDRLNPRPRPAGRIDLDRVTA